MTSEWNTMRVTYAVTLVATGSINTLSTKWADLMTSINSNGTDVHFHHPFVQADGMFVGQMLCLVAFYLIYCSRRTCHISKYNLSDSSNNNENVNFPKIIFYIPAVCDMLSTSINYVGLTLTYASSFQMLRGSVIVFTGLLSMAFLHRRLRYFQWLGIFFVIAGLVIVGLSDFLSAGHSDSQLNVKNIITGDILIICAQVVTAIHVVIQEKFIAQYNVPPLLVVGWEGMFSGNPRGVVEDVVDAATQLSNNNMIFVAILGNTISIAFFNFAGVSITKELSATTRMVLDSIRTLVIWLVSLAVGWQKFQYLQLIGFTILIIGMFLYNDVLIMPFFRRSGCVNDSLTNNENSEKPLPIESMKPEEIKEIKCEKSQKTG